MHVGMHISMLQRARIIVMVNGGQQTKGYEDPTTSNYNAKFNISGILDDCEAAHEEFTCAVYLHSIVCVVGFPCTCSAWYSAYQMEHM